MSRAEELAKWHEAMAAEPKRNEGKRKRHAESVAELRRLSAVEAELEAEREESKRWRNVATWEKEIRKQAEMIADKAVTELIALKKAIGDAESVAWMHESGHVQVRAPYLSKEAVNAYSTNGQWARLYTLKGIK